MATKAVTRVPSLDEMRVEDVMHRGVVSCTLETPLRTVARTMAARRVHCIVGVGDASEDTTLWGVVSDRDVLAAAAVGDVDQCDAGSCVGTDFSTVTPDSTVRDAAKLMNQHGLSHLVVVRAGSDRPLGVISTLDIAGAVGGVPSAAAPRRATRVDQLMTTPVVTVAPETPLKDAAALLVERGISGMPVVRDGEVVGILSEADIVAVERGPVEPSRARALAAMFGGVELPDVIGRTVADVMSEPAITVATWQSAASAAALMTKHGVKRLPVVDNGRLVGIVSRRDLVRAFARSDDEIQRDIREEVLSRELWLAPDEVDVEVEEGEVKLTGSVDSEITAGVLVSEVRKVPGVVAVDSTVVVRS